jgi:putative endonuclease
VSTCWHVYVLLCADGTLYSGVTTDPPRRLRQHREGTGARYTRARGAVGYLHVEEAPDRSGALKREAQIKRLRRAGKLALARKNRSPAIKLLLDTPARGQ